MQKIKQNFSTYRKSTTRFPMSLRWSSYVALSPVKGAENRKTADFRLESRFAWRKSATKFLYVKIVSDKVVSHLMAQLSVQKWLMGRPLLPEILG